MPPFTIYYLNKCSFARIVTILLPFGSINNSSSLKVFISIKATMYTITAMMIAAIREIRKPPLIAPTKWLHRVYTPKAVAAQIAPQIIGFKIVLIKSGLTFECLTSRNIPTMKTKVNATNEPIAAPVTFSSTMLTNR